MRISPLILALGITGLGGCDQRQSQMLDVFQKQLQTKDKMIEDLTQKVNDLEQRNAELQAQAGKGADAEKVAEAVNRRLDARLAEIKSRLDQAVTAAPVASAHPAPAAQEEVQPPPPKPSTPKPPSDPNRKKMKFDF